jgi:Domain of unknown function (DUF4350)
MYFRLRALALVALGLGLFWALPARAGAFDFSDAGWEGDSELYDLAKARLGSSRVEILSVLDWERLRPGDGILILHPTVDIEYDEASAFLRAGGRIALLDDFGKGAAFLERFQIHRIPAPLHPLHFVHGDPALAVAVPAVQLVAGQEQGRHPVVAQVDELVTNHPTALTHPNLTPVLKIPSGGSGEPDATLAVTGIIVSRGRLFAMADPSATINLMLRYPGNRAFAEGLCDYLVEDDSWGARSGRLYLLANGFKQKGSYGGGTSLAQDLKEHFEGFEEMVHDFHDDGLPELVAMLIAVMVGVGMAGWTLATSARTYRRSTPRYAAPQPLVAQGGVAGRAAVLAAPTTHRALALLELKSALEEGIAQRLGLSPSVGPQVMLQEIDRQGLLARRSFEELRRVMTELARAENAVLTSSPMRVSDETVERTRRRVLAILGELGSRSRE